MFSAKLQLITCYAFTVAPFLLPVIYPVQELRLAAEAQLHSSQEQVELLTAELMDAQVAADQLLHQLEEDLQVCSSWLGGWFCGWLVQ